MIKLRSEWGVIMKAIVVGVILFVLMAMVVGAVVNKNNNNASGPGICATMNVKEWFPQGPNYVFECHVHGFRPIAYDWDFKDGQKLYDIHNENVWHTYTQNGFYVPSCTASDAHGHWAIGWVAITVSGANQA